MRAFPTRPILLLVACLLTVPAQSQQAPGNDYASMLGYLTSTSIDGQSLAGATGVVGVNLAAGDNNQQANLRLFAMGPTASTMVRSHQIQVNNLAPSPDSASAIIGGSAFRDARGVFSINQASGGGNTELNVVSAALATQGIREAGNTWFATAFATAGGSAPPTTPDASGKERHVAVESTAMRGAVGVVQLNQVAGSGNAIANVLQLSVSPPQR